MDENIKNKVKDWQMFEYWTTNNEVCVDLYYDSDTETIIKDVIYPFEDWNNYTTEPIELGRLADFFYHFFNNEEKYEMLKCIKKQCEILKYSIKRDDDTIDNIQSLIDSYIEGNK